MCLSLPLSIISQNNNKKGCSNLYYIPNCHKCTGYEVASLANYPTKTAVILFIHKYIEKHIKKTQITNLLICTKLKYINKFWHLSPHETSSIINKIPSLLVICTTFRNLSSHNIFESHIHKLQSKVLNAFELNSGPVSFPQSIPNKTTKNYFLNYNETCSKNISLHSITDISLKKETCPQSL